MSEDVRYAPLRVAILQALRQGGTDLLQHPRRLVGHVMDIADPSAPTTISFERNCDLELLRPFSLAASLNTSDAIAEAASRAIALLIDDRMLRQDAAERLACEIAFALGAHQGVPIPDWIRAAATQDAQVRAPQGGSMGTERAPSAGRGNPQGPASTFDPRGQSTQQVRTQPQPQTSFVPPANSSNGSAPFTPIPNQQTPPRVGGSQTTFVDTPPHGPDKKRIAIIAAAAVAVIIIGIVIAMNTVFAAKRLPVVSAGWDYTVTCFPDGTVRATGKNDNGQCEVDKWKDIVNVSAGRGHTLGLKSDGTVVATGNNDFGQCNVKKWTDITSVAVGRFHSVGLRKDGTVIVTGRNNSGQCNVSGWTDIVAIAAGVSQTVGLKSDGTVVATGRNTDGRCDVDKWEDIVAISTMYRHVVGLKSDGTVVATGDNTYGQCDVDKWKDIVCISAGANFTMGVRSDGTVVAVGRDEEDRLDIDEWTDVVAISAGKSHTAGIQSDGTILTCGNNADGQCNTTKLLM